MKVISKAVLAGIGALALGGTAVAAAPDSKVIRVTYPDGSVQHIRYRGDIAPKIVRVPVHRSIFPAMSLRQEMIRFDRIMAAMDRRMDLMMRRAARLTANASNGQQRVRFVSGEALPPGTVSYSFVSTTSGGKTCSRSVRVVAADPDQPARVERASSGDCAVDRAPAAGDEPNPPAIDARRTI